MLRSCCVIVMVIVTSLSFATPPDFFDEEIDQEYRAFISHIRDTLPETDVPLLYLQALGPYNLLDVRPTKIMSLAQKQSFTNFNYGVFGGMLLNIPNEFLMNVSGSFICKEEACTDERVNRIYDFLDDAEKELASYRQNQQVTILQQSADYVYRINDTFYTPTQLITYSSSKNAGFIPSAQYTKAKPIEAPDKMAMVADVRELLTKMTKHYVAAVVKEGNYLNIVFGGVADNHWGGFARP